MGRAVTGAVRADPGQRPRDEAQRLYRTVGRTAPTYPAPRERSFLQGLALVVALYVIATLLVLLVWYAYLLTTLPKH